jgi:hypothetical protein
MKTFDKNTLCPHCHRDNPQASTLKDGDGSVAPVDGNLSICIGCGAISVFDRKWYGGLRKPTAQESAEIMFDAEVQEKLRAWGAMDRERRKQGIL